MAPRPAAVEAGGDRRAAAIAAPITRNQATVCGSTSSNSDTAIAAPMYCEIAERTNSASGGAVSERAFDAPGDGRVTASVEQLWVGAADLLPERLEAEPAGERVADLLVRVLGVLVAGSPSASRPPSPPAAPGTSAPS